MRTIFLVLLSLLFFYACPAWASDIHECMILRLTESYDPDCAAIIYNGEILAGLEDREQEFFLVAAPGFRALASLSEPAKLAIPRRIQANMRVEKGRKLYVKFNDQTDCAWTADGNGGFHSPRCFDGAERDLVAASGFRGGIEVGHDRVDDVVAMEMLLEAGVNEQSLVKAKALFVRVN